MPSATSPSEPSPPDAAALQPQAQRAPPSPSPPPPPPTALTPGPRAAAFQTLYANALASTLGGVPYSSFAACFPTAARAAPGALAAMHRGLVERLAEFAHAEFEVVLRERRVVERLNALEDVIAEARRRKARAVEGEDGPVPPHTLPATELVQAHLAPLHIQQQSQLNAKLQTTASQNASLAQEIKLQREAIQSLVEMAESLVRDLEGSGEAMATVVDGENGVSGKARQAEEVLGGF